MSKRSSIFNTIRTEGAILPAELLQRIINGDTSLDGLKSTDYHFSPGERLNEAATRSWNRLSGVWKTYRDLIDQLPDDAIGTTETRERWLLPLFQELGYGRLQPQKSLEIEGKSYPISHKATEPVAIHLVSFKWDLDRRNPVAKGETKLSPHSLVQEFLNRSKDHLWGFLSNGFKLRILRDNISLTRTAYVEFDLQAMMDNEAYSDFFLLYLLCHQSRVEVAVDETGRTLTPESCWLEKWYNTSITDGFRALDELRNNVQAAIESLGAGFIAYPHNTPLREKLRDGTLSLQGYYTQVLRQVYRLLFVFVAEDRDLLLPQSTPDIVKQVFHKYYSTYRIRELARKKRGTRHCDLWYQLNLLFKSLYDGNGALGLPALGSFLFREDSTQDLANCEIANSDLLSAVRFLCYTQKNNVFQPINYRNLGPEELGSVYESLLEMHPEIDLNAGFFKLNLVAGSERKTTGSYYTPSSLVNCLLDTALEPVIEQATKGKQSTEREVAIISLKICDPACGSGHFLIAAAHRIAKRLAAIRAGEEEPAPSIIQHALRDVIGHCIYGVDINPMSVELCKISLWMEALEPGKPLAFLDHHIQCGNSLLGCTPALLKKGIPDAAFSPLTGDEKEYCSIYKKRNKDEQVKEMDFLFDHTSAIWEPIEKYVPSLLSLDRMADDDIVNLHEKEAKYCEILKSSEYLNTKFIYDAWCAAFVWKKKQDDKLLYPITQQVLNRIEENPLNCSLWMRDEIQDLALEYKFLHWHIAFPDIFMSKLPSDISDKETTGWTGGFDCILGNPPWEHVELKEQEWFANRDSEIAKTDGAKRKKLITALETTNPALYQAYIEALRFYHATCSILNKESGIYPLCGRGRINTYMIFAELNRILLSAVGHCGCIVPSGIATDDTTKFFFQDLFDNGSLISLYDFENSEGIFPGVHRSYKFCLLTMRGLGLRAKLDTSIADFFFFAHNIVDLSDSERRFQLSKDDIALINPNTRNCPIFRSKQDAELSKFIYNRVPVLINESDPVNGNPWGITFKQGLFNMTSDSHLFKTKLQLEDMGFGLLGNHYVKGNEIYLPLYEGKMVHHFDYRWADASDDETSHADSKKSNPSYEVMPRYWIGKNDVQDVVSLDHTILMGFRGIARTTDERTIIGSLFPYCGVGNSLTIWISSIKSIEYVYLYSCLTSLASDFVARNKVGGTNLNFFIVQQFAVLAPDSYNHPACLLLGKSLTACALELLYTSYSLKPFAQDCGYDGPPFIWDEERRFEIRCELDALYFHLYLGGEAEWQSKGTPELLSYLPTPRIAVDYIMDTFPIVKRKDEKQYGEYRTKRRILEIYDQMTHCLSSSTEYQSVLNPLPGPPCYENGEFIPMSQWDISNWPVNIHSSDTAKVEDSHIYVPSIRDRLLFSALIAVLEVRQKINENACFEVMLLLTYPSLCRELLPKNELKSYDALVKQMPEDLFTSQYQKLNWLQIREYLEAEQAIDIDRSIKGSATFSKKQGYAKKHFADVKFDELLEFVFKAHERFVQLQNAIFVNAELNGTIDKIKALINSLYIAA